MSNKILGIALTVVGVALQVIPGIGQAIGLPLIAIGSATISTAAIIGLGLTIAGSLLAAPSTPKALSDPLGTQRLSATLHPTDPRKIWFGHTAGGTDIRYQVFNGANQEYLYMIVACASHAVHSIDELWLDNEKAWNGSVLGRYSGYLTVTPILEGTSSNGIAIDGTWTSHCTLTGCAYLYLAFKLTGNSDKVSSPFASGVTSRMTIRGKGAKVYDPRLDSTVEGGSGSMRADDQTTWAWDDNGSRNPALQELFYELGWKINGKLAVGKGVPPSRIDLASYAVAANLCDESVALNGGGTEPRYRSDGLVSEADDTSSVRDNLCASMNAILRDAGGKLSLTVIHNDLATPVMPSGRTAFDHGDTMGELQWEQTQDLSSTFNVVRGRMIDASDTGLYQPVDFPDVSLTSIDGIDRIDSVDYPFVQSNGQAQRLAKQRLERNQYQGKLTFSGKPSFWGLNLGDVFPLTHPAFGWEAKLFRVAAQKISRMGQTDIVAVEENSDIYQWDNDEAPAVLPGAPTIYDPLNNPIVQGVIDASSSSYALDLLGSYSFPYTYNGVQNFTTQNVVAHLKDQTGVNIASGLTWKYAVISGTVNGNAGDNGVAEYAMTVDVAAPDSPYVPVSSLGSNMNVIEIRAYQGTLMWPKRTELDKALAPAPAPSGGTGAGSLSASTGLGGVVSSGSGAAVIGSVSGSTPSGVTSVSLYANVDLSDISGSKSGSGTVSIQWQRLISGTWTNIGSAASGTAKDVVWNPQDGSVSLSVTDSGLTASTAYQWRVVATQTAGSDSISISGTATVTG